MIKEIDGKAYIATVYDTKEDINDIRENLISLLFDITAENIETNHLFDLVLVIDMLKCK